jgi:nicotinate-nucleotide pyrophosphorylase (carboxylating)
LTDAQIERWLAEDLGHRDVSNHVPGETTGRLVATEAGVAAGLDAAVRAFEAVGADARATVTAGEPVDPGSLFLRVEGPARAVLRGERVAANLVGHASGVATATRRAVDRAREAAPDVAVACTRKTTPGLRGVEKRAVAAAGGDTHRLDLSGMVMVKENHVAELGLEGAIERFHERKSFAQKLEVEAETVEQAVRAAEAGADVVLLDNLSPDRVAEGVDRLPEDVLVEASGGITLETVADYAATGVDVVSMGSLTHSAPQLDVSFRTGDA